MTPYTILPGLRTKIINSKETAFRLLRTATTQTRANWETLTMATMLSAATSNIVSICPSYTRQTGLSLHSDQLQTELELTAHIMVATVNVFCSTHGNRGDRSFLKMKWSHLAFLSKFRAQTNRSEPESHEMCMSFDCKYSMSSTGFPQASRGTAYLLEAQSDVPRNGAQTMRQSCASQNVQALLSP